MKNILVISSLLVAVTFLPAATPKLTCNERRILADVGELRDALLNGPSALDIVRQRTASIENSLIWEFRLRHDCTDKKVATPTVLPIGVLLAAVKNHNTTLSVPNLIAILQRCIAKAQSKALYNDHAIAIGPKKCYLYGAFLNDLQMTLGKLFAEAERTALINTSAQSVFS